MSKREDGGLKKFVGAIERKVLEKKRLREARDRRQYKLIFAAFATMIASGIVGVASFNRNIK